MGCGSAVFITNLFPKRFEDLLEMRGAGHDDAHFDDAEIKQKAKVIEVPVKEGIFIVPFDFKPHFSLEAIDFMGGRIPFIRIYPDASGEFPFFPSSVGQKIINALRDLALAPAAHEEFAA